MFAKPFRPPLLKKPVKILETSGVDAEAQPPAKKRRVTREEDEDIFLDEHLPLQSIGLPPSSQTFKAPLRTGKGAAPEDVPKENVTREGEFYYNVLW